MVSGAGERDGARDLMLDVLKDLEEVEGEKTVRGWSGDLCGRAQVNKGHKRDSYVPNRVICQHFSTHQGYRVNHTGTNRISLSTTDNFR